jgi:hypothetical protein
MNNLLVPTPVRVKLGDAASDGIVTMFADAHRLATSSFEQRLDHNAALMAERVERQLADLRSDLFKWSFLFWIGQLAAIAWVVNAIVPRG